MNDPETRAALVLTLRDIAEYFDAIPTRIARYEAALLKATCPPLLEALGTPYSAPLTSRGDADQFSLRLDPAVSKPVTPLESTVVQTLTDATDYLLHLSEGGVRNSAIENYITMQSLGLLDQLGAPHTSQNPLG